jgi:hypothetical protein
VLGAGFAQLYPHVDEARRQAKAATLDGLDILADAAIGNTRPDRGDAVAVEQQVAGGIERGVGIEQAGAAEEASRAGHGTAFGSPFPLVMAGLDPAIPGATPDPWIKPGNDELKGWANMAGA